MEQMREGQERNRGNGKPRNLSLFQVTLHRSNNQTSEPDEKTEQNTCLGRTLQPGSEGARGTLSRVQWSVWSSSLD